MHESVSLLSNQMHECCAICLPGSVGVVAFKCTTAVPSVCLHESVSASVELCTYRVLCDLCMESCETCVWKVARLLYGKICIREMHAILAASRKVHADMATSRKLACFLLGT